MTFKPLLAIFFTLLTFGCASSGDVTKAQQQQQIHEMKDAVLTQLFKEKPDTRAQINSASGYAVFSNANINVIFLSAGAGYGVVKNMRTGQHTYMNMAEGGFGLGFGAKDYRVVMVFHNEAAIAQFIESGWTFGGNADAAAVAANRGGSVQAETYFGDVTVYTITKSGLALQATVKGMKFWKDKELN